MSTQSGPGAGPNASAQAVQAVIAAVSKLAEIPPLELGDDHLKLMLAASSLHDTAKAAWEAKCIAEYPSGREAPVDGDLRIASERMRGQR